MCATEAAIKDKAKKPITKAYTRNNSRNLYAETAQHHLGVDL